MANQTPCMDTIWECISSSRLGVVQSIASIPQPHITSPISGTRVGVPWQFNDSVCMNKGQSARIG